MKNTGLQFYHSCVGWPGHDVHRDGGLVTMIDDSTEVTRATFLRHVCRDQVTSIERLLGYTPGGMLMSQDSHVTYHKSKLHGKRVYYFRHSAIEYVFTREGEA